MSDTTYDRLTSQLASIPGIIGSMGVNIAQAQQLMNADYTDNLMRLAALIKASLDGVDDGKIELFKSLLLSLSPVRYQFTETTLDFRADLSEALDASGTVGFGFATGAIMINAAASVSYGYNYRAAARVTTVLHAVHPSQGDFADKLIERAKTIAAGEVALGKIELSRHDETVQANVKSMVELITK